MKENSPMLECNALTEIFAEINSRIISSTSSNNKRKMKDKLKQGMKIREKYDCYGDGTDLPNQFHRHGNHIFVNLPTEY